MYPYCGKFSRPVKFAAFTVQRHLADQTVCYWWATNSPGVLIGGKTEPWKIIALIQAPQADHISG